MTVWSLRTLTNKCVCQQFLHRIDPWEIIQGIGLFTPGIGVNMRGLIPGINPLGICMRRLVCLSPFSNTVKPGFRTRRLVKENLPHYSEVYTIRQIKLVMWKLSEKNLQHV